MATEFLPDKGFRLQRQGKSIILGQLSIGKPSAILTDRQIVVLASATLEYLDSVQGRRPLPKPSGTLTPADHPPLNTNVAFKFMDDIGVEFWRRGNIRLSPPATYLTIENELAQDQREGIGMVYLQGASRFATFTSQSGFNSLIICTSADARQSERRERARRFGHRLIKITDAAEFAARVAFLSGAERYSVRDVVYSNIKAVKGFSDIPEVFVAHNGLGNLHESSLEYLAADTLEELIRVTEAASIFTKPVRFRVERERRFHFAFPTDVQLSRHVEDSMLADLVEVIN